MAEPQIETAGQPGEAAQTSGNPGIVYILENQAFAADVVMIGKTPDLAQRMNNLATAVPSPFLCAKASRVDDMDRVEKILHDTFHHAKKHWRGEFFEVEAWRVAQVLSLCELEDVTHLAPAPSSDEGKAIEATVVVKERKENFNFAMVDIPIGEWLHFVGDEKIVCKVERQSPARVELYGTIMSLSAAAQRAKQSSWGLQGTRYWKYGDETLQERRERIESLSDGADG